MSAASPGPRLEMRQGQSLVMTQQLQQSIKLLQMTAVELQDFLTEEVEKNPLLSLEGGDEAPPAAEDASPGGDEGDAADDASFNDEPAATPDGDDAGAALDAVEDGWGGADEGYQASETAYGPGGVSAGEDYDFIEDSAAHQLSLRDHLLAQLPLEITDPVLRFIATHLVDLVDDAGYIKEDITNLHDQLGCTAEQVAEALAALQSLDPAGVCARNLAECLVLQLRDKNRLDPAMQAMLDHLDLVGKNDIAGLQKLCGVDAEDVRDMIAEIRTLNPKPGHAFQHETPETLIPDVILRRGKTGGWLVELNAEALPRVLINRRYHAELSGGGIDKQGKKYLTDQINHASWLVKALDQRANTILRVGTEIVSQQDGFFRHGVSHLKPMTLRDIAGPLAVHESTVSRVTSNKYIATPRGIYKMKDFFSASLQNSGGADVSSRAVQHMIQQLVEAETADAILSDDAIADRLNAKGIDIARRTVAKYREEMKIPSSTQRRREKTSKS